MNRVTLAALFFLSLHFITKPLGCTYPSINETNEDDFSSLRAYDNNEVYLGARGFDSQDELIPAFNEWEDQEQLCV